MVERMGRGARRVFPIGGVPKVVFTKPCTFLINSACHTIGRQPYSKRCSARDSFLMAIFTFGEGYHNYHHEFQHDYRNGVKPWQWDPTKWLIWTLSKLGLTTGLRRVPREAISSAQARVSEAETEVTSESDPDWENAVGVVSKHSTFHLGAGSLEQGAES